MKYSDFEATPSGRLVPTIYGEKAFMPHNLPPKLDLGRLAIPLANANAALGELKGSCRRLNNPYLLIRPLQRLEAQTSSAMEGTHTTADELAFAESGREKSASSEAREVANYTQALNWATNEITSLPISGRLLKGAHKILMSNVGRVRGEDKRPGEYKRDQNMIGGRKLSDARFIPPPRDLAIDAMSNLEAFINRDDKSGSVPLLDMALVHYQFETIHPFADGNGRLGRMLISLMALTEGLLEHPILYISPELEHQKDEYIDLLYRVSSAGEWEEWVSFFLNVVEQSSRATVTLADRLIDLQANYKEAAMAVSRSANLLQAIDYLFERPVVAASDLAAKVGVTDAAARALLKQLTGLGVLTQYEGVYPRVWIAREIINLSAPDSPD